MWIFAALAGLAAVIVLAFSVPLDLELLVDTCGRPKFKVRLAWFFGLVRKEIARKEKDQGDKGKALTSRRKVKKGRPGARTILNILRVKGLLKQVKILLRNILRLPRVKKLEADFKIGFGDAAGTGLFFALMGPVCVFQGYFLPGRIKVRPSFADEAVLEGSLYGLLRIRPIKFLPPLVRFVFSPPALRVAKMLFVSKWRRRK